MFTDETQKARSFFLNILNLAVQSTRSKKADLFDMLGAHLEGHTEKNSAPSSLSSSISESVSDKQLDDSKPQASCSLTVYL